MDATRALLDELMGKQRNVPLTERSNRSTRYDDPTVCKYDLAGICPHGLFKNTRSDLGPCQYELHSDHLDWEGIKADYEKQDDREKERYEKRLLRYLEDLIREMDRKIAKSKDRAEKESAPRPIKADDQMRLDELQQRAKDALTKSQRLGEEGDVDAAMMLTQQADAYKKQHEELFKKLSTSERQMTVCDICGVFINSTDNDERRWGGKVPQPILDHLNGKQYLGWKAIREQFTKLQEKFADGGRGAVRSVSAGPAAEPARERERERERSPRREEPRREERPREERRDDRYRDDRRRDDRGGYDRSGYDRRRDDRGGYDRGRGDQYSSRGSSSYGGGRERERDRI